MIACEYLISSQVKQNSYSLSSASRSRSVSCTLRADVSVCLTYLAVGLQGA